MQEQWKFIPNSNDYFVSNLGNVGYMDRGNLVPVKQYRGRVRRECKLKEDVDTLWYPFVAIKYGDIRKGREVVHRLVAKAFVKNPNPDKYKIINHIDGDKSNNVYTNLEWCNHSRNNQHAFDEGLNWSVQRGTANIKHKLTEEDVRQIFRMRGIYSQTYIAAKFGINQSNVSRLYSEEKWAWLNKSDLDIPEQLPIKKLLSLNLPYIESAEVSKPYHAVNFKTLKGNRVWNGIAPDITSYGKANVIRFEDDNAVIRAQVSASAFVYLV